jgi:hypothetical protein
VDAFFINWWLLLINILFGIENLVSWDALDSFAEIFGLVNQKSVLHGSPDESS